MQIPRVCICNNGDSINTRDGEIFNGVSVNVGHAGITQPPFHLFSLGLSRRSVIPSRSTLRNNTFFKPRVAELNVRGYRSFHI